MTLTFEPHYIVRGMQHAKQDGYSVITGEFIQGFEVQFPSGGIKTYSTLDKVERLIKEGKDYSE